MENVTRFNKTHWTVCLVFLVCLGSMMPKTGYAQACDTTEGPITGIDIPSQTRTVNANDGKTDLNLPDIRSMITRSIPDTLPEITISIRGDIIVDESSSALSFEGGRFFYTPDPNINSPDVIDYQVRYTLATERPNPDPDLGNRIDCIEYVSESRITVEIISSSQGGINAVDDNSNASAGGGAFNLNVLNNDSGNGIRIISVDDGGLRGSATVIDGQRNIRYKPPTTLGSSITDQFSYIIESGSLRDTAIVRIRVDSRSDRGEPEPTTVPTTSIGRIRSELPIARAVENLCDLLTFRNSPGTPGGLNAGQEDLLNCACAIVNEPDGGTQRNAIRQLSGGQHQFSDTVLRFAKTNASIIQRRMTELRRIITKVVAPELGLFENQNDVYRSTLTDNARSYHSHNLAKQNRSEFWNPDQVHDGLEDFAVVDHRDWQDELESFDSWLLDTLSINSNSVYFSATDLGQSAGIGGLFGNRLGFFTSITSGKGDNDDAEFEFDFDAYEIISGIDYSLPGSNRSWVVGAAIGISKIDTESKEGAGGTESDSAGLTLYTSMFNTKGWFVEGTLNYSRSDIDVERVIQFIASNKSVFQTSSGDTGADEFSISFGGGKEFNFSANTLTADLRLQYLKGKVDGLTETISEAGSPGSGLALQTDEFNIESFRSELGLQFSRAMNTNYGVMMPYISAEWIHEFEDRGTDIPARFVVDPYSNQFNQLQEDAPGGNRPTLFVIPGSENDSNYLRLSLGSSFTFVKGKSAWITASSILGIDGLDATQFTVGFRWEFGN